MLIRGIGFLGASPVFIVRISSNSKCSSGGSSGVGAAGGRAAPGPLRALPFTHSPEPPELNYLQIEKITPALVHAASHDHPLWSGHFFHSWDNNKSIFT